MVTRKARFGLLSFVAMVCRRFEARGEMDMSMGLPESSVRGFCIAWAGFADDGSEVVARVRRGVFCACVRSEACVRKADTVLDCPFNAKGARKSRCRDCHVAAEVALLYVLDVECTVFAGLNVVLFTPLLAARRHDAHIVTEEAMMGEGRI